MWVKGVEGAARAEPYDGLKVVNIQVCVDLPLQGTLIAHEFVQGLVLLTDALDSHAIKNDPKKELPE
jgi:hypothetical protein